MAKLTWRVGAAPTGLYKSFHSRVWPHAYTKRANLAAFLEAENSYHPQLAETTIMRIKVADWSSGRRVWRLLTARPVGVKAAKALLAQFLDARPEWALEPPTENN